MALVRRTSVLSTALIVLVLSAVAVAAPATYKYTGNPFSDPADCQYLCDYITAYITYASPLPANAAYGTYFEPAILSWSFTDGNFTLSSAQGDSMIDNTGQGHGATNAAGLLINWGFDIGRPSVPGIGIETADVLNPGGTEDVSIWFNHYTGIGCRCGVAVFGDAGQWSAVPEPSTFTLLLPAMSGAGLLASRRNLMRRRAR